MNKRIKVHPGVSAEGVKQMVDYVLDCTTRSERIACKGPNVRIFCAKRGDTYVYIFKRLSPSGKEVWLHAITLSRDAVFNMGALTDELEKRIDRSGQIKYRNKLVESK